MRSDYKVRTVRGFLQKMLDHFKNPRAWTQGVMHGRGGALGGSYCLVGELRRVGKYEVSPRVDRLYLEHRVGEALKRALPVGTNDLIPYNDNPNTTIQDIRDLIVRAKEFAK